MSVACKVGSAARRLDGWKVEDEGTKLVGFESSRELVDSIVLKMVGALLGTIPAEGTDVGCSVGSRVGLGLGIPEASAVGTVGVSSRTMVGSELGRLVE